MNYNYFPMGYQPVYQQPQQSGGANAPIWVQGESAAKAWFVPPNNTVALWDSESQTIYLKSADASGMPTMHPTKTPERSFRGSSKRLNADKCGFQPIPRNTKNRMKKESPHTAMVQGLSSQGENRT